MSSGRYAHEPTWYRNFLYTEEAARGLDCVEDLASPGTFTFDLALGEAALVLRTGDAIAADARALAARIRDAERARRAKLSPIDRAADAYLVRRGAGHTIIAGYPWFTDWGRDTFIALRGLVPVARPPRRRARDPHRLGRPRVRGHAAEPLPRRGRGAASTTRWTPRCGSCRRRTSYLAKAASAAARAARSSASAAILDGYARGTRYGIRIDADGLLACGEPGAQLTWMDAKVGDRVVTPRIGKPVEVQALWINALRLAGGAARRRRHRAQAARSRRASGTAAGEPVRRGRRRPLAGRVDAALRPNQIFAVGGLPHRRARRRAPRARVVDAVERELLDAGGPAHARAAPIPSYRGALRRRRRAERDGAYHQGTVWPWLAGAVRRRLGAGARRRSAAARREARDRFLAPLAAHVGVAGLGHLAEIADGDPPHTPRGCPFQAWSLGELLRAQAATS